MARRNGTTKRGYQGSLQSELLESENDNMLSSLSNQVANLKGLTMDIEAEVLSQNQYLDGMESSFSGAGELLNSTMTKLNVMMTKGGSKHMLYLAAFVCSFFMLMWWFMKRSR